MTWELTQWGKVCRAVADFVLEVFPEYSVGIGPDPEDLQIAAPSITFLVNADGQFVEPPRSGGLEHHPTFDERVPVRVQIWEPIDLDATTNYDKSPVRLERVVTRFLEGCDTVRHVPYLVPMTHSRRGGRIGEYGAKAIIGCRIQIQYRTTPFELVEATKTTMNLGIETPDGDGSTVEPIEVVNAP